MHGRNGKYKHDFSRKPWRRELRRKPGIMWEDGIKIGDKEMVCEFVGSRLCDHLTVCQFFKKYSAPIYLIA
jgi:hypothetical protein